VSAGLGDPVSQDAFVFTVNSMECGISQVGSDLLGEEAQGQYCKISVSVENAGNEAEYFSADSQVVYDDQGREFEADTGAMKIPVVEIHCKACTKHAHSCLGPPHESADSLTCKQK